MSVKYVFNVYDHISGDKIDQVIVPIDHMLDTLKTLNEIGYVKGYIVNFDDYEEGEE